MCQDWPMLITVLELKVDGPPISLKSLPVQHYLITVVDSTMSRTHNDKPSK